MAHMLLLSLWVKKLIKHESPTINGDGTYSRDFTYIDNVIQANEKAALITKDKFLSNLEKYYESLNQGTLKDKEAPTAVMDVFNIAFGGNTSLIELFNALKLNLTKYDDSIANIEPIYGQKRQGDIPYSRASIMKAQSVINYILNLMYQRDLIKHVIGIGITLDKHDYIFDTALLVKINSF